LLSKCAKTHLNACDILKNFPGLYPGPPLKWEGGEGRRGKEVRQGRGKGRGAVEREEEEGKVGPRSEILDTPLRGVYTIESLEQLLQIKNRGEG
jgi:hypothetical protein